MRTDEALMAAYARGDAAAFDELFQRHAPPLLRVMRRRLRSETDAQDLVQQTFLQLHRARLDFDAGARFRPWFFTIAFNLERELYRKRRRRPEEGGELDELPSATETDADTERDVQRALQTLPADTREVIELHWLEGLSFPDIAGLLGASTSAVKVRAHRGYARMRKFFEGGE